MILLSWIEVNEGNEWNEMHDMTETNGITEANDMNETNETGGMTEHEWHERKLYIWTDLGWLEMANEVKWNQVKANEWNLLL